MKNLRAIILLFIANSISGVAQGISMIAIPWYFAKEELMGNFGIVYIIATILALFWSPYSGTLIDKYNRKHIFLVITTISSLLLFSVSGLGFYMGHLPWYFVGFVFMFTFFNYNIHYPNLYAFVQEISVQKYYGRITSAIEVQGQLTTMLAGAFAAILLEGTENGVWNLFGFHIAAPFDIKAWTIYEIFLMDAATYVLGFCIILLIRYKPIAKRIEEKSNIWEQLLKGYDYLKAHPNIFLFGIASYSIFMAVLITTFYLAPVYVEAHLLEKGDVFATADIWFAVGAVFAGLAIRWLFKWTNIPFSIITMTIITTILFAVLAFTKSVFIFYVMFLLLGLCNAGTRIQRVTYLFTHLPNQFYGRASSIFFLFNSCFRIIFLSIFAWIISINTANTTYTMMILSIFLGITVVVLIKYYRSFLQK